MEEITEDIVHAIQDFRATVASNLLAPDDFIDWNAVCSAVSASSEAARRLDELRSPDGLDVEKLAIALHVDPSIYGVAHSLIAFNTSGSQVTKWGLPASIPSDHRGRLRIAKQLLYVGLNRVLEGPASVRDLLTVAEIYKDSGRRRFRSGSRMEAQVGELVRNAVKRAGTKLDRSFRIGSETLADAALRRSADFIIACDGRPIAAISTVFQNQSGGRQLRDLSVTYPLLQDRFAEYGVALILIADGQGLVEASDRTLAELFRKVRFPMSMEQASAGALEQALLTAAGTPTLGNVNAEAVARLITEGLKSRAQVHAAELPVNRNRGVLALARYAEGNKELDLILSPDGEALGWRDPAGVATASTLQQSFDPRRALELLASCLDNRDIPLFLNGNAIWTTLLMPETPPFTGRLVAGASSDPASPKLARQIGLHAIEDAPGSSVAILVAAKDLSELELRAHRQLQGVLPANLIVIGPQLLLEIAKAKSKLQTLISAMLNQSDLTKVSPFILSNATPSRMFYGRDSEAAAILNTLGTNSVALLGSRRIGKTSLLRRVRTQLDEANFLTLFGDCQTVRTWNDFARLAANEWGVTIPLDFHPRELGNLVRQLGAGTGKQVVILLDEIDQLLDWDREHAEHAVPEAFFRACRSLSQDGAVQFVFTGERQIAQRIWDPQSPHWNFCRPLQLAQLTREAVTSLLIRPLRAMQITIDNETSFRDEVWLRTSGHPQIAQFLGDRLVRRLDEQEDRRQLTLGIDDIRLVSDTYEYAEHYVNTYWGQATPLERDISVVVASEPITVSDLLARLGKSGTKVDERTLSGALRMLQLYGIVYESEGCFSLRAAWFSEALSHFGISGTSSPTQGREI